MRIVIEVLPLLSRKRGSGVYTENLIKGLAKIDKENEYILFGWVFRDYKEKIKLLCCPEQENFSPLIKRFPNSLISNFEWKLGLPVVHNFLLRDKKVDIYHSPVPRLPKLNNVKKIITVHDLIYEFYPNWVDPELIKFVKASREAVKNADTIIAVSQNTKNDLIKFYNLPENKIVVIYEGVDTDIFHPISNENELLKVKQKYSLPEKFILEVGPFEPKRNTENLLLAYKKLKEKIPDYKIVLVGSKTKELQQEIQYLELINDVIWTGYVSQEELVCIYNLATIFIHPAFYEGFGLSVLEAMACGCPVITSNVSSLPEVAGEAAILIHPENVEDLKEAVYRLISDEILRKNLIQKGFERIKKFTWQKTATETLTVYKNLM